MHGQATIPFSTVRRRWRLTGQIQGVGFRPFVYRLAREHGLTGLVRNDSHGVVIEAQGPANALRRFASDLRTRKPPLASIDSVRSRTIPSRPHDNEFCITDTDRAGGADARITTDTAVCAECLGELFDRDDRRFRYGLTNCTHCGPRYSMVLRVPYDRPNTTMAHFAMCPACQAEYAQPADRRFHAQPIACHGCGPDVAMVRSTGAPIAGDPYVAAARLLADGKIVAVKGIGGFHLAVRADDERAVRRLRTAKRREAKPFAVMVRDLATAEALTVVTPRAADALTSPAAPIVLLPRRDAVPIAAGVAPGTHRLGVMLPYTPIHHLLFAELPRPVNALVMTSGNVSDEPLVIDNAEAVQRLGGICDAMLWHNRPIARAVDDSVWLDVGEGEPVPIRRSRGAVPTPMRLPAPCAAPGLCVGGELKNTIAVVRPGEAILSQHLGDLKHPLNYAAFERAIDDLCELCGVTPRWIAHDTHPAYLSSEYARRVADARGLTLIPVQHHHAHAASLLAEHGQRGPMLAIVCDGVGYGPDGTSWGGELLLADTTRFRRLARMRPILLPGGDAAARETGRCALALIFQAIGPAAVDHPMVTRAIPDKIRRHDLARMIERGVACTTSSALGRVFDGVAALLGLCERNDHEAQAAMALEAAAETSAAAAPCGPSLIPLRQGDLPELDPALLCLMLADDFKRGVPAALLAARFHDQVADAWVEVARRFADTTGVETIGLSGGVFCNARLTRRIEKGLNDVGLGVLRHRAVPPNDGGLSLGQAAIACARIHQQKAG